MYPRITEEHLHHMARRHHALMKKLDDLREKHSWTKGQWAGTTEYLGGALLGGALEGRTGGAAVGPIPVNLGIGAALVLGSSFAGTLSKDVQNLGNGFIGSWAAAAGYAFGKSWKETNKFGGGGAQSWSHPYAPGAPIPPPTP